MIYLRKRKMIKMRYFLQLSVEHEVYIGKPEGFVIHGKEFNVFKLKKDLYGLKQYPRSWYGRIINFIKSIGFSKGIADPTIYIKIVKNHPIIFVLYVDDFFLSGEEYMISQTKRELSTKFEMGSGLIH
jgi:hypothetical protein